MFSKKFRAGGRAFSCFERHVNAPYLRQKITLPEFSKATLTVTGTGFYRLYVNGENKTKCPLAPYLTNPDSVLLYDVYDLTEILCAGENVLGFCLGNGIVNSFAGYIWDFDKAIFRAAPSVAFALEVETADGRITFEADDTMKTHPSPVIFDEFRAGIHYDARLEIPGWSTPAFDDSAWEPSVKAETPRGEAQIIDAPPLTVARKLTPKSVVAGKAMKRPVREQAGRAKEIEKTAQYQPPRGEEGYLFDFGENVGMIPTLRIHGEKGQVITMQFGEYAEGNEMSWENIERFYPHGYAQRDIFICSGGDDEWTADFTFHGAQYCLVMGLKEEQAVPELLTANVLHSFLPTAGTFTCSDPVSVRLAENVKRSDLSNFVWLPTDCPHREKNGWTGDAAMSTEHMLRNFDAFAYFRQWMRLIRAAQRSDGAIPGIVPTSGWGYEHWNGPVWDQVIVEIPYRLYQYRGDLSVFRENVPMIVSYLNYISSRRDKRGLMDIGLGDYVQPFRSSEASSCPTLVSDSITCVSICRRAALLFEKCDMKPQAAFARALGEEFLASVRKYLINFTTMTVASRSQCAQAMGLYYEIFTPAERPEAYRVLLSLVSEAKEHIECGMLGVRILFHVLAEGGDTALAYRMITRLDPPSYGYMSEVRHFSGIAESFGTEPERSSLNHHFFGDISNFFMSRVAGLLVNPTFTDPRSMVFAPAFLENLTFAETFYESVSGRVTVRWERQGEEIVLSVTKPDDITVDVILPEEWEALLEQCKPFDGCSLAADFSGTMRCHHK